MLGQHDHVVFQVLADLEDALVLEHFFQDFERFLQRDLLRVASPIEVEPVALPMLQRHVAGLVRLGRHGDADEARLHGVEGVGFGVEGDVAPRLRFRHAHSFSRAASVTVSYFSRSTGILAMSPAMRSASFCGLPPSDDVREPLPFLPLPLAAGTEAPFFVALCAGGSASSASAIRRVRVLNSISTMKPNRSSASGSRMADSSRAAPRRAHPA